MNPIAKMLVVGGIILVVAGLFWQWGGRFLPLGKLPGDIRIEHGNVKFYFPIVTCILISVIVSGILYIIRMFK